MHILVMGVSGSGKTTIAALLAGRLALPFLDADDFHPPGNLRKLQLGIPLTDTDRWPWLAAVRAAWEAKGGGVLACSALKAVYREVLLAGLPEPTIVYLYGERELIAARLALRHGHFAAPSILASQLKALEEPAGAITVHVGRDPDAVLAEVLARLGVSGAPRPAG